MDTFVLDLLILCWKVKVCYIVHIYIHVIIMRIGINYYENVFNNYKG